MSDDDKGFVQFLLNLAKHFHYFTAAFAVQISCGLISKNDLRIGDQGSRDGHTLLLASGELVRKMGQTVLKPQKSGNLHEVSFIRAHLVQQ